MDMAPLMGDDPPSLTRAEMVELVKKIQNAEGSPSELGARVILFERNCVHPAGTDFLYLTDEYFGEDSDPEPEEIADKAMSGK